MYCGNCGNAIDIKSKFCSECGMEIEQDIDGNSDSTTLGTNNDHVIEDLEDRLQRLENLGVNHPKLINRAFTVWGYYLLAQLVVAGVVLLFAFVFGIFS